MKKLLLLVAVLLSGKLYAQQQPQNNPVVLAYVTSWSSILPDPDYVTHINYAFGHVNESFNGVIINRPPRPGSNVPDGRATAEDRLRSVVELKKQKPSLKILLSIGGWGSGRFSEMAADPVNRLAFAADCQRLILEFGLDGIDMDWEYPTSSAARISSSPEDTDNFTLLMRDIRQAIGKDKLLTFASAANAGYVDFRAVDPYVDFINIMTYDFELNGSVHHAGLFRSGLTGEAGRGISCEESVEKHIEAGVPIHKLTLGIPFYGRGRDSIPASVNFNNTIVRDGVLGVIVRGDIVQLKGHKDMWDDVAQASYWVDADGKFVLTYETPKSIAAKCAWLKQKGMLGAMYWEYAGDDPHGTLRKAVYYGVMGR